MHDQRALIGAAIELEFVNRDMHGEPADADNPPTVVAVRRSDATSVLASTTATQAVAGSGRYQATIPAASNTLLDILDATWTVDTVDKTSTVAVVGGFYFGLAEAEADGHAVYGDAQPDDARRRAARTIAEAECERITRRAWVPQMRDTRILGTGSCDLVVPEPHIRSLRSVDEYGADGTVSATWTPAEVAAVSVSPHGIMRRLDGTAWPERSLRLIYDVGHDAPPADLAEAVARRYRWWLARSSSAVPDRASTWSAEDGTSYRFVAGRDRTGDPDVDAIYWSLQFGRVGAI